MGARRQASTESKLDMTLDELVDRHPKDRDDRAHRSRGPYEPREGDRDHRDRREGKGKGKRRLAPEEKALLNTHCFFDGDGDLVVRLYDTKVAVFRKPATLIEDDTPSDIQAGKAEAEKAEVQANPQAEGMKEDKADVQANPQADEPMETPRAANTPADASASQTAPGGEAAVASETAPAGVGASPQDVKPVSADQSISAEGGKPSEAAKADVTVKGSIDAGGDTTEADGVKKPAEDQPTESKSAVEDKSIDMKSGTAEEDQTKTSVDTKPSETTAAIVSRGMAVILSSGRFKTVETRFILNEVLHSLSLKITEGSDGHWSIVGTGQPAQIFEDGMKLTLSEPFERTATVKDYLVERIAEAKGRDALRQSSQPQRGYGPSRGGERESFAHPHQPPRWGVPHQPPPPYGHHQRPLPGWPAHGPPLGWPYGPPPHHHPPPPGWGLAPPHPHQQPSPHHRAPSHGSASAVAAIPQQPAGPLPDSMFQ